ncbi:hypothetical protein [Parasitella parasitica]|uniref:Zn(2)-C6 fungal-type domain-containing protein n=1 Tax=Parasitella parasitica TaxID=35722 RepID=A0A0B7NC11_9FUNG|nr:hypothetical protein [Parasitella parasitica]
MQQFTPYFPGFDNQQQQQQQQNQGQAQSQQPQNNQTQPPPQQLQPPMSLTGANLAIYSPASMPSLSVLAATQVNVDNQQQPQGSDIGAHGKPKRKQVKNACVNCQKACKKCDVGRPCQRCIKYGLTETCVNSVRKERKKGIKRGPYKKRNKNVGGESVASSGTSTPMTTPVVNTSLYSAPAPINGTSTPTTSTASTTTSTTSSTMPLHYQPFQTTQAYDPYGYNSSSGMMPQAYMVPNNLSQMYPTNPPVLSYQAAMNIISPQQQQSPVLNSNANSSNSADATSSNSTPAMNEGNLGIKVEEDDDDEGSKLTILSQLCSSVLANNDGSKQEATDEAKTDDTHQNTPPPSRPHSREASHENNNTAGSSFAADSNHTYVNSHLSHVTSNNSASNVAYGTPGSSPASSPVPPQQQQQQAQAQAQAQ